MTIQNLFIAELTDVIGVYLKCGECGAQAVYEPDGRTDISGSCPQCRETWNDPGFGGIDAPEITAFLQAFQKLRKKRDKPKRITVRLAYDLGKAEKSK